MAVVIEKLSFSLLIFLFVLYIIGHIVIILWYKKLKDNGDEEQKDLRNVLKFLSRWFHLIYAVIILGWLLTV